MVFMANWEPQVTICGDRQVTITRGQFSTSTRMLAAKLGCSRQTLFTFLDHLESTGMIRRENIANRFSIITIVDYEKTYQPLSVKRSQKQDKKIEEKPFENDVADDGRKSIQSDGADRRLDRKLDHIKKDKNIKKENTSISSLPRAKNEKFYQEIRESETFWSDASQGLSENPDKLRQMGEHCFGELMTKGKMKESREEVEEHLFNWLRRALEFERNPKSDKTIKRDKKNDTDKKQKADIDSRRGADAPPPDSSVVPKRRFAVKNLG